MGNHLFDAIRATHTPEAVFIETAEGRSWTYGDMIRLSGRLAATLHDLGVRPGDRVAVKTEKSPEALMLYLACLRVGAVYLPLNTAYTLAELDYFIGDAEPRLVVVDPNRGMASPRSLRLTGVRSRRWMQRVAGACWNARVLRTWILPMRSAGRTTWRRSCTHPVRRAARRARC